MALYWMHVYQPINRKLKNGVHLVEAEIWRKGWWRVKVPGALRATMTSPRVWSANPTIPYTGQPFGLALQELHKKETKNGPTATKPISEPNGPVCELGPAEARQEQREAAHAAFTRPDRVRRQRAVRRPRRAKV